MNAEARQTRLIELGGTVATAESLTGGQLAARFTAIAGSSAVYVGGVVTYATRLKVSMLGVSEAVIAECGVVSEAIVEAMALGVRERLESTYGLATTGVAGPGPADGVPAGTVWVAVAGPSGVQTRLLGLDADRAANQAAACDAALSVLDDILRREEPRLG